MYWMLIVIVIVIVIVINVIDIINVVVHLQNHTICNFNNDYLHFDIHISILYSWYDFDSKYLSKERNEIFSLWLSFISPLWFPRGIINVSQIDVTCDGDDDDDNNNNNIEGN